MSKLSEAQLADIGKRLAPSQAKDPLLKLLKQAAVLLQEVDQSPPASTVSAMKACTEALVLPSLLRHKDKDVRLLVATCISEIMRIVAPEAPYEDDVLKDIFHLIVAIFQGLNEVSSPSFPRRVNILETVAKVRSCVVMLDLECDDLILEMFHVFFNTASEEHPQNVFVAMRNILALVLEESEEVSQPLLEAVLTNLLKDNKDVSPAAHKLAVAVVERCADKLEPYVQKFLTSVMLEGKGSESELQEDYHAIIYEIYRCAPQMLLAVIPNLTRELVTDQVDVRLKAVELLGRLFALPGQHVAQEYKQLFSEFLKRFADKAVEVRLAVVACAKACLEANPSGPEASDILTGLDDRLLDFDDKVRMSVVKALCDFVNTNPKWVPKTLVKKVADRLRDKKVSVRKDTLQKLAEVYRTYTTKCKEGSYTMDEQFEWIPSKIVRCAYDKDFRPQGIEIVFTDELFSKKLPVEERSKHWIAMLVSFDKNDEKAFRNILGQKQRLQVEMQNYLTMRQKSKEEDTPELQKKIQACFKAIATSFVDAVKAEENLQKLHQMKDNNIFKSLSTLLSTSTLFAQAQATRDELLKRIGDKHPQHDFIRILATKCSYLLFNKEHVKAVLKEISIHRTSGNKEYVASTLSLLVEFAGFFPALLEGTEGDLLELLKDSDESIKEGVVHILAKAGGSIRDQIVDKESSVDLTLEQLCLEGSRKQAKHAVSAIAAISADSGLKALSVLYGRLVDLLEDKTHLPTILQSLGCIAENSISVFETREEDIVRFVIHKLLKRESVQQEGWKPDWENPSEECRLKIYGLKVFVKSLLPIKEAHLRSAKLKGILGVVSKLLTMGEVSEDIKSSDIDKANLRLAAGKAVLRLARRWDQQIPPSIVHSTLLLAHDPSIEVRQKFLNKVHQFSKERALHQKYASVFALVAVDPSKDIMTDGKRYLADFVETCRREARSRLSLPGQIEGTTITYHPEYVLTYLVHVLAHQSQFPSDLSVDIGQFEPAYRQLLAYLRALVHQDGDGRSDPGKKEDVDNIPAILAILRTIKNAEDLVEKNNSEKLYILCDIGIFITKELGKKKHFSGEYPGSIPLPAALYKTLETVDGEEELPAKVDGSHLPVCFTDKDVLARLRTGSSTSRTGQPSSPRGQKRERRSLDEDSSSDEGEKDDEADPQAKRSKHNEAMDATGGEREDEDGQNASPPTAKQSRGKKKSNSDGQKNGILKVSNKQKKEDEEITPKRKRGRPKGSGSKAPAPAEDVAELSDDSDAVPTKLEESAEKLKGKKLAVEKQSAKKYNQDVQKTLPEMFRKKPVRGLKVGLENSTKDDVQEGQKRAVESTRSPVGTPRKASQRSSTSIVDKSPAPKVHMERKEEELIGCKVKVWWPLDKRFYRGAITAYDPKKKKHKVTYDDGEVEHLNLANEKYEITDTSKAISKVAPDKLVVTPSSSNQSGKLKRKAPGQTVDNGSQSPGPSDKKRAITPRGGKETSAQTLQGVGRGLAQAKSGSLSSPASKNAKSSASISAGPFAFSDEDFEEPASEKGAGKHAKGSSAASASEGVTNIKFKRKTESEPAKEPAEGEKPKEKGVVEKAKEKLKDKLENENLKDNGEKLKGKADTEKAIGKVDADKAKAKAEGDKAKAKVEDDKAKAKVEADKAKARAEMEKAKSKADADKAKVKADADKAKAKAEAEKAKAKSESDKAKAKAEADKAKAKAEAEKTKAEAEKNKEEAEVTKAPVEKTKAKVEVEKSKSKVESEKPKAKTELEKSKGKVEVEKPKGKVDADKSKEKEGSEKAKERDTEEVAKETMSEVKPVEKASEEKAAENVEKPKEKLGVGQKLKEKVDVEKPGEKVVVESPKGKDDVEITGEKVDSEKPEAKGEIENEVGNVEEDPKVQDATVEMKEKGDSENSKDEKVSEVAKEKMPEEIEETVDITGVDEVQAEAETTTKVEAETSKAEKVLEEKSADLSADAKKSNDDEPLDTWRTRRRKLH